MSLRPHITFRITLRIPDNPSWKSPAVTSPTRARMAPELEKLPVDATIIGIVDTVNVENQTIFSARNAE